MGSRLCLHVNAWTGQAVDTALCATGRPIKVLNTAVDEGALDKWSAANPGQPIVYRQVFEAGNPDTDIGSRCKRLIEGAKRLRRYRERGNPIVIETPWNEERQARPLVAAYATDTIAAVGLIREAFPHEDGLADVFVAVGHQSVQWPQEPGEEIAWEIVEAFLPAIIAADFFDLHTYGASDVESGAKNVARAVAIAQFVFAKTGKRTYFGEFGIDWGVLGYELTGYRGGNGAPGKDAWKYAGELEVAVNKLARCVVWVFVYCCGTADPRWETFNVAGEEAIKELLRRGDSMLTNEQIEAKIENLEKQNAYLTAALIALRKNRWTGAEGVDGQIVAMTGKPLDFTPTFPKP